MDDRKPDEVASVLEEMHGAGKGVIGMKILGEGRINTPERKDASLRYVLGLGTVTPSSSASRRSSRWTIS